MSKVYLGSYNQQYSSKIVATFHSPRRYVPIIRYAIEKYMMEDVNSIDAVCIKVAYTSNASYCGSKYARRHIFHSAENGTYIRIQYPDVGVYLKEYRNCGVDNFFVLLVTDTIYLRYNLICRISVKTIRSLDSDTDLHEDGYSYLCEL